MRARATPYDDELARLHDEVSDTIVGYGASGAATRAAVAAAAPMPAPEKAERAGYLSAKKDKALADDLVGGVASGRVDLAKVPASELPAALSALPLEARQAKVAASAKERGALLDRIGKLSSERDSYLRKSPGGSRPGSTGKSKRRSRRPARPWAWRSRRRA